MSVKKAIGCIREMISKYEKAKLINISENSANNLANRIVGGLDVLNAVTGRLFVWNRTTASERVVESDVYEEIGGDYYSASEGAFAEYKGGCEHCDG